MKGSVLAARRAAVLLAAGGVVLAPSTLAAREYELAEVVETAEDLWELLRAGELEDADDADALVHLLERPLELNRADRRQLYELPGVTGELAQAIVDHRAEHGSFEAVEELLAVAGMTPQTYELVAPFVVVEAPAPTARPLPVRGSMTVATLWRRGGGKSAAVIDASRERSAGPQSHLRVRGQAGGLRAGLLATVRRLTRAHWDLGRGQLVSQGPAEQLELDQAYVHGGWGRSTLLLGSYDVGFGERLTLDTTPHREPHGWYELDRAYEDLEGGKLRVDDGLFGAAYRITGLEVPAGELEVTLLASRRSYDLYQGRGVQYGYDDGADPRCDADGDCRGGYRCDDILDICLSSAVYDESEPVATDVAAQPTFDQVTFDDAYRELLGGGNVTLHLGREAHLGVTAYGATTEILLAREASPRFAPSARMPEERFFGAVGVNGRARAGAWTASGEYALTGAGGHGAYARVSLARPGSGEATLALRYYDPRYENPHGRGEAARDLEGGLAQRNEAGARIRWVVTPARGLRLVADGDLWRPLAREVSRAGGGSVWQGLGSAAWDARLRGGISCALTREESVYAVVQYDDKDLGESGRDETYEEPSAGGGRGERRTLRLGASSSRLPRVRLAASVSLVATDVARLDSAFDHQQTYRVRARVRPWEGGGIVASLGYWRHERELAGTVRSDREKPRYSGSVGLAQELGSGLTVRLRYGVVSYRDLRPDRFSWYHLVKLAISGAL